MSSSAPRAGDLEGRVGLCARCRHARTQTTKRGSEFWRCLLAETDARFVRYPALPVRECPGFEATSRA
jgi:hypothetical protein